jgi:phenylacetate-CoA ligase
MTSIPPIEKEPSEVIVQYQFERIGETLRFLEINSPFYKALFAKQKMHSSDVQSWAHFSEIPTTSKDDLQQRNWDFLCVPKDRIVEFTSTSGTLGKPVTIALTEKDLQRLAYNESISFACAEGCSTDLFQLMLTLDRQFMAGIAYYEGIRKMGAGLIRVGPGLPALQWETIERLKPNTLVAVPSFLVRLIEFAIQQGIDLNKSSVKKAICIGENLRTPDLQLNALGKKIRDHWDIKLFSTYASTEMQTAFTECREGLGGHLHPELIYVELLDEKGKAVRAGEMGEVTITTLGVEGMPLLRYRTGDMAKVYNEACACGRNTLRLGPVEGRKQQMIKLKGTTLYPPAVFEVLQQVDFVIDYVVEAYFGALRTDELRLHIHVEGGHNKNAEELLSAAFQSRLRVIPEIVFVSQREIDVLQHGGASRKVRKFIDNRNL